MSACIPTPMLMLLPSERGKSTALLNGSSMGPLRLSTDPIGIFTLRLNNVVEGSRVRVETLSGEFMDEYLADSSGSQDRALPLYASGNPLNSLRIKVRNASGTPAYRPFETQATAQLGVVTVFVFQEPDE